ncbi:cell division protein FtsZ [Polluticoccus soli]|uniref:cell division protein FtsZ n=1 Tax=Polluticoccus soli TaxID=3034150 RepID=UPI0023E14834|nr:cell division protein FtsZ [Flavipsychrobacter sp. JY13-12]
MIHFEIPKNQSSIIKVIGVGGGGGNAVNYMHNLDIEGVDFIVCNTDSQALALSPVPNKIQLGPHLTQGLGAGANPEIGKQAGEESMEDISKILKVNTRMAFITAGMGGGTGTGGAPVVAKICRDLGILTVGIVTTPFTYEGRKRMKQAQEGIDRMREHVDTILIISNDKLRQQFGNLPFTQAFAKADDILATAAKCITDVINTTGQINVDFADVCTVMKNGGVAILGSASVAGDNRSLHAVEQALNSPLLNDNDIRGAKWILLNITSAAGEFEHTMDEAEAIQAYVQQMAGDDCDVILGMGHDPALGDKIAVTVIATGFNHKEVLANMPARRSNEPEKIVVKLGDVASVTPAPAAPAAPAQDVTNALAPTLVEMEAPKNAYSIDPKPAFPVQETQREMFTLDVIPAMEAPVAKVEETKTVEEPALQLVIKNEEPVQPAQPEPVRYGSHVMTEFELEEKRRFEEQKRALEERAERLRRMSFNVKGNETTDDVENVPAYVRRNVDIDSNGVASSQTFYSGYSVGVNGQQNNNQASIQTINTFLDGKKPD